MAAGTNGLNQKTAALLIIGFVYGFINNFLVIVSVVVSSSTGDSLPD